jgi:putative flippase GtrA
MNQPRGGLIGEGRKFFGYALAGFAATGAHYITMISLVSYYNGYAIVASSVGFLVGACVKYPLNYWWIFHSRQRHAVALPRFAIGLAIGFALNAIILAILLQTLDVHYMVSQVLTTGVVLFANYAIARLWIFRNPEPAPDAGSDPP